MEVAISISISDLFLFPRRSTPPRNSFSTSLSFAFSFSSGSASKWRARAKKKNHKRKSNNSIDYIGKSDHLLAPLPQNQTLQQDAQPLPQFADAQQEKLDQALSLQFETDLNLERMRHYEVVFLIHEKHDEQVEEVVTKVEGFIREKKGRIWRLNDWGLRRLAYQVKKAKRAHYILMNFEIETKFINDFKTMLDKHEMVIRHLVTKADKAETEYCPPPMEYHTMLARQGYGVDDDGFWDDDDGDGDGSTMYNDDADDADDGGYLDDGDDVDGEDDGEVIYVDGDEDDDENRETAHELENVLR